MFLPGPSDHRGAVFWKPIGSVWGIRPATEVVHRRNGIELRTGGGGHRRGGGASRRGRPSGGVEAQVRGGVWAEHGKWGGRRQGRKREKTFG